MTPLLTDMSALPGAILDKKKVEKMRNVIFMREGGRLDRASRQAYAARTVGKRNKRIIPAAYAALSQP